MKIAFIGAGKMATAIAKGMTANSAPFAKEDITACDASSIAAEHFTQETSIPCSLSADEIVDDADFVLLAVKPQNMPDVMRKLRGRLDEKCVVSIAAGVKIDTLSNGLAARRVVRVMPNTPLMIGEGATALAPSAEATDGDIETAFAIFAPLGVVFQVEEKLIDAVTALSGSGPAYFFEMIDAMAESGAALGLSPDVALELAIQTARGAAGMLKKRVGTPSELRDAVTSPGGTTAAALNVMRERDFRGTISSAMKAARDRSVELGAAK